MHACFITSAGNAERCYVRFPAIAVSFAPLDRSNARRFKWNRAVADSECDTAWRITLILGPPAHSPMDYGRREALHCRTRFEFMILYAMKLSRSAASSGPSAARKVFA